MKIDFPEEMLYDEQFQLLKAYHKLPDHFKVDKEDVPMVVMALNQDDIVNITVDDDGAIEIGYSGDEWQNEDTQYNIK